MTKPKPRRTYYNYNRVLSYNALWNFICGARGVGKTYGAQKRVIRDAIKKGDQFVYVRRYRESELKMARATFFAAIEGEFPDWDFRTQGFTAEMAPVSTRGQKGREWQTIGFFVALTGAQSMKSTAFPRVKTIIFDEFIAEKGATQYLKDEVTIMKNLYSTIARDRDDVIVLFLANAVSIMNPYFIEYKIRPDEANAEFIKAAGGFIVVHLPESKEFQNETASTRWGQFIAGTDYAEYASANQFRDNGKSLIEQKDPAARYRFTLETKEGIFSVWVNNQTQMHYAQQQRPRGHERIITVDADKMDKDKVFVTMTSPSLASLRAAFRTGMLTFDAPVTRNALAEIFKK